MRNTPPIAEITAAIARLRSVVARALMDGPDPADLPDALADTALLRQWPDYPDQTKLDTFTRTLDDRQSLPGMNRRVVLARAQRYLHGLSMWLEDHAPAKAPRCTSKDEPAPDPVHLPFDERMLSIRGVGPKTAARLASRGIATPVDLLFLLPRRYDDRRTITPIPDLQPGMRAVTRGTVVQVRSYGRPWKRILEVVVDDEGHRLSAMWFTNRRPRTDAFEKGTPLILAGLTARFKDRLQMAHPVVVTQEGSDRIGRIVPVYPEIDGVPGAIVEKAVRSALVRVGDFLTDPMPAHLIRRHALLSLPDALEQVHCPPDSADMAELDQWIDGCSPAHRRLIFDEFFYLQLALAIRRNTETRRPAPPIPPGDDIATTVGRAMDFSPTDAQRRAVDEILADMGRSTPMRRLLQGDVGSGKTMVALCALLACARAGYQAALMAPTEILAEQHMRTLGPLLDRAGIRAALHMGSARSSNRRKFVKDLESGVIQVAIGTHALLSESVHFHRLALAVVDEQHRFGVAQRLGLSEKAADGRSPHLLVMTATPIPRSLALTIHGDLDMSILDELPAGRVPIATRTLSSDEREVALATIDSAIERGEQAYVVCPIIEESDVLDVSDAEQTFARLKERWGDRVGLLHSRLSEDARTAVMDDFLAGRVAVLVCTTVIEVGVNVPTATVMLIEGAERFGLAQLHQLRGRIGRSHRPSICFLCGNPDSEAAHARLQTLTASNDGFFIARRDLEIRGPGELYGRRQAGLPGFVFGNLQRDAELLEAARQDALDITAHDPTLSQPAIHPLKDELLRRIQAGDGPVGEESG